MQLAQLNNPGKQLLLRYHCGIRVYSMTMSGTCATHVLTKAKPKAVWSRRLRCEQVSRCWWSVNCCVQACKQTQRDTQRDETREMCSCWGYKQQSHPDYLGIPVSDYLLASSRHTRHTLVKPRRDLTSATGSPRHAPPVISRAKFSAPASYGAPVRSSTTTTMIRSWYGSHMSECYALGKHRSLVLLSLMSLIPMVLPWSSWTLVAC